MVSMTPTAGERAARRFLEFFAATIRNRNTREAYYRACCRLAWCEDKGITDLVDIDPLHVASYVEELGRDFSKPTVKQHLAERAQGVGPISTVVGASLRCAATLGAGWRGNIW